MIEQINKWQRRDSLPHRRIPNDLYRYILSPPEREA